MTTADRLYSHPQSSLRQMVLWRIISTMPAADNFSVAGAALAAREIGYTKVADLIVDERFHPSESYASSARAHRRRRRVMRLSWS
jgi:hypothetical protein